MKSDSDATLRSSPSRFAFAAVVGWEEERCQLESEREPEINEWSRYEVQRISQAIQTLIK